MIFRMKNYRLKLLVGTTVFSAVFLGLCVLTVRYFPATEEKENENKAETTHFNSYTVLQNELLMDTFLEDSGLKAEIAEPFPVGDKTLALYRNAQSRPAVEWFFSRVTASREIAQAILEFADENDISPGLAFAVAYVESRYKSSAKNVNENLTIDRGLFQLNSATFTNLSEEEFYNPRVSARYGLSHLRYCIDVAGNEITGLAIYNAGASRVKNNSTPQRTLNYVAKVTNYRNRLESQFAGEIIAFYSGSGSRELAMLDSLPQF